MSDQRGLSEPVFIIKSGDIFYITTGVLEFDRAKAGDDLAKRDEIDSVEAEFDASSDRNSQARKLPPSRVVTAAQTELDPSP